jgi:Icc-related predicted phosphoesterase
MVTANSRAWAKTVGEEVSSLRLPANRAELDDEFWRRVDAAIGEALAERGSRPKKKHGRPISEDLSLRIVVISDTHGQHRKLEVPRGDLLIHAGDFTLFSKPPSIVSDFDAWLGSLPHRSKVVVPGNHEFILEEPQERSAITNAILLMDAGVDVEGFRIWGSPVTPLYGGAFGMSRAADRKRHWARIPDALDILITHGPPFGILDEIGPGRHDGCPELLEAVLEARPRVHVFGHTHAAYGMLRTADTTFVNASLLNADGGLSREPIVLDLEPRG